uniref:Uncharacterized protein n=1 Tax=Parascaris univalens TaxID=6257 RepID=A0A915CJ70_PARUN
MRLVWSSGYMISGQGPINRHGTSSEIKPANRYCCNVASAKDELEKFWSQERRKNKSGRRQNAQREIKMKQDREITEEWALATEEREPVFDAPPFTNISEESFKEQGKSTADAIRDDAEEIIEAASDAFQKSSAALARELEDIAFRWRWIVGGAIAAVLAKWKAELDRSAKASLAKTRQSDIGKDQGQAPGMELRAPY